MRVVIVDIETESIPREGHRSIKTIWCIVCKDLSTGETKVFTKGGALGYSPLGSFREYAKGVDYWVAHNGVSFDIPVLSRLLSLAIPVEKVIDTFIISRLINYTRFQTHSLDELGSFLKCKKSVFNDWSGISREMVEYCIQDVEVTQKVYEHYKRFIWADEWQDAIKLEHQIAVVNEDMSANGFLFNKTRAKELLVDIKKRMSILEDLVQSAWPPELEEVNRIKYRKTKDGELFATVQKAMKLYSKTEVEGDELVCYDYQAFNPGSTKDRIEKLWESGWNPVERTKTHNEFLRSAEVGKNWRKTKLTPKLYEEKKAHFDYYGWKVNEINLKTLPEEAPEGAHRLAEWLTLEGRRSSLEEWLGVVQEDSRIHGKFWNIGAWTHRMSHSAPNQANIFSPFPDKPKNAVEEVKAEYDRELRALWCTDKVLVGTDADGIQLRILCHYMQSETYREAIVNGKKENETDIHNVNKRALGLNHLIRDDAKTFIYAWLLGAGVRKVASILKCNTSLANTAMSNFLDSLPELKRVKKVLIPADAKRGFFTGLDGRKVLCDSEHLMLAGYLQNGEAIVTKRWIIEWRRLADEEGLWYRMVDYVHDEVQVEVETEEDGKRLIELQQRAIDKVSKDLNLFCPLAVSGSIGKNWAETH